jgi:hypothetical protein
MAHQHDKLSRAPMWINTLVLLMLVGYLPLSIMAVDNHLELNG